MLKLHCFFEMIVHFYPNVLVITKKGRWLALGLYRPLMSSPLWQRQRQVYLYLSKKL